MNVWKKYIRISVVSLSLLFFCAENYAAKPDSVRIDRRSTYFFDDGSVYIGQKRFGKPFGTGYTEFVNGDKYEGEYVKGLREGIGIHKYADGNVYSGYWHDDKQNGEGELRYLCGDVYKGEWVDGNRTGKGVYIWKDGSYYSGEWTDNRRNGTGMMMCQK